jgi:hydrogenase maturation protease
MGLSLLPFLEGISALLVVDAVQMGRQPGSLIRLAGQSIQATLALKLSVHQVGLQELLAASFLQGTLPPQTVLLGIEPLAIDWGVNLSPQVGAALDSLVDAVASELRAWGVAAAPREERPAPASGHVTRALQIPRPEKSRQCA